MSTVTRYLADHEVEFSAFEHRRAQTANEEARALGVVPSQVAKTLVLRVPYGYVLAVIPASRRLNFKRVADAIGVATVGLATEREIAAAFPGFELGAIPPIGSLLGVRVYIDRELAAHEWVTFASGRQSESVKVHTADLCAQATVEALCEPYPTYDEDWME